MTRRVRRVVAGSRLNCMVLRAGRSSFAAWDENEKRKGPSWLGWAALWTNVCFLWNFLFYPLLSSLFGNCGNFRMFHARPWRLILILWMIRAYTALLQSNQSIVTFFYAFVLRCST